MFGVRPGKVGKVNNIGGRAALSAALALDFINNPVSSAALITTTRLAGGATNFDSTGTLQIAAVNTTRVDYPYTAGQSNYIRNSVLAGAGTGTPGTYPTNVVAFSAAAGITTSIAATGTEGGMPYIDVRFQGTTGASTNTQMRLEDFGNIAALTGQAWTHSCFIKAVSLTTPSDAQVQVNFRQYAAGNSLIGTAFNSTAPSVSAVPTTLTRYTASGTNDGGSTVIGVLPRVIVFFNSASTYDFTLRFAGPMMDRSASVNPYTATSGSITTATTLANGFYNEEGRTNSIRNARAEGAVLGSPGTLPTNWNTSGTTGISSSIVGSGTENGLPYVDINYAGTAGASGIIGPIFETGTAITAATAQTWCQSVYCRLVAGTMNGISAGGCGLDENTAAGAFVVGGQDSSFTPTTAPLASQRASYIRTFSGGGTVGALMPYLRFPVTNGAAVNITLRVACPQTELGAYVSSLMLQAAATPGAIARSAETTVVTSGSTYYNLTAGTLFVHMLRANTDTSGNPTVMVRFDDGFAGNNRFQLGALASSLSVGTTVNNGGVTSIAQPDAASVPLATDVKIASAIKAGAIVSSVNGAAAFSGTGTVMPANATLFKIGQGGASAVSQYGMYKKLSYWKRALSAAEVQAATT